MDEPQHMKLQEATDSTLAKAVTRFGVPVFLAVISVLGGTLLIDIKNQGEQNGAATAQLTTEVRVLQETVNAGLVWRITEIERRINTMEEAKKTP